MLAELERFEKENIAKMERWAQRLRAEDLDALIKDVARIQEEATQLAAKVKAEAPELWESHWLPLARRCSINAKEVTNKAYGIRNQALEQLGALNRGKASISGYRAHGKSDKGILDHDG